MTNSSEELNGMTRQEFLAIGTGLAIAANFPPAFGADARMPMSDPVTLHTGA